MSDKESCCSWLSILFLQQPYYRPFCAPPSRFPSTHTLCGFKLKVKCIWISIYLSMYPYCYISPYFCGYFLKFIIVDIPPLSQARDVWSHCYAPLPMLAYLTSGGEREVGVREGNSFSLHCWEVQKTGGHGVERMQCRTPREIVDWQCSCNQLSIYRCLKFTFSTVILWFP